MLAVRVIFARRNSGANGKDDAKTHGVTYQTATSLVDIALVAITLAQAIVLWTNPWRFVYDDSLFYFQIAESLSQGAGLQFVEGMETNGFHPFWLLICSGLAAIASSKLVLISYVATATILLNIAIVLIARVALGKRLGSLEVGIGLMLTLPYVFFIGFGMETSITCLFYLLAIVATFRFYEDASRSNFFAAALCAGLAVFARLDMALAVAPLCLVVAWKYSVASRSVGRWILDLLAGSALGIIPVGAWLTFNWLSFGHPIPISGLLKLLSSSTATGVPSFGGIVSAYIFLSVLALLLIAVFRTPATWPSLVLGAGQVAFVGYLLLGNHQEQYSWYFAPLALATGLLIAAGLHGVGQLTKRLKTSGTRVELLGALATCIVVIGASAFLMQRYASRQGVDLSHHAGAKSLGARAAEENVRRVIAFDRPGQLAFLDSLSVFAADGLTTNVAFQEEFNSKGIHWLISRYDIDAIVTPSTTAPWRPESVCDVLYLGSTKHACRIEPDGSFEITSVQYFSRLTGASLGEIQLEGLRKLDFSPPRDVQLFILPKHERGRELGADERTAPRSAVLPAAHKVH